MSYSTLVGMFSAGYNILNISDQTPNQVTLTSYLGLSNYRLVLQLFRALWLRKYQVHVCQLCRVKMNVKNDNNKLYTISKIHRATYEFKPEQHGLLKKQRLGQGPRKKKHSFLTGHIRRVLVVKCNYLCIYLKCLLEFCFKILFFSTSFFLQIQQLLSLLPLFSHYEISTGDLNTQI